MNSPPAKSPHSSGTPTSLSVLIDELIAEILSRLPVKTLMQMKCVCKSWKTLISNNPFFAKLHLHRSSQNTHLALFLSWSHSYHQDMGFSVVPFPISRLLDSPDDTILNDPRYHLSSMDCNWIAGSCNGLICLLDFFFNITHEMTWHQMAWLRLWNPATNTMSKKLGYFYNDGADPFRFAFGYDDLTYTYKVVAFSAANNVKVFSFGDNVWRNIESFPVVPFGFGNSSHKGHHGVYLSNTVNWLAIRNKTKYEKNDITIDQFVIVSLDLGTETYQLLLPPQGFVEVPPFEPFVSVLMECLCFSHHFKGTHFVLWKMMEFGVQESWTQFLKISYQDLQINYGIHDRLPNNSQLLLLPLCVSESSNTLIMAINQKIYNYRDQYAILYNWRDNRVDKTRFTNEILWFYTEDYVESLVSTS